MRKPYMTGAKPESIPNEPKMYPYQGESNPAAKNLDSFAEQAQVKPAGQLDTVHVPIDPIHVFGKAAPDPKPLHSDTKMTSAAKLPSFADQEKVKVPKV